MDLNNTPTRIKITHEFGLGIYTLIIQFMLAGLKINNYVSWSWYLILTPLLVILLFIVGSVVWGILGLINDTFFTGKRKKL